MADIQSNIQVNIDTTAAAASLKNLQRQISAFHTSMAKSGAAAGAVSSNLQQNLINSINRGGEFAASMKTVKSSAESFTTALEKNKLSMGQYFRYAGASTKTFGRLFTSEFNTIEKVARERVKTLQTQYIKLGRDANGAIKSIAVRPLALDMESLATKTAMAAQKQQLFNQLMKQGSTNLLNFGKNTQWAGRQLMVGFTIPLAYLGTTAAKTFMEMEKQAVRFKRVYGEIFTSAAETDQMAKEIENLGKQFTKYGVAVSDTMKLAADAASMGKMGADLTAQVAQATRLAVLGGVEQEQALETTISLTNAFGIASEELAGKINFLNAVENQTATSIEDLTIAIPKAGPVIQQLGGDVEDLAFFLTAMKEGGINASEGANALKSGLAAMINPTGKAAEFLQSFGVNLKEIVEANKGDVKGTVIEFAQALDTLDPLNRAQAIEQLFGKFQFARLSTLFQNVVAQGSQASKVLTLTQATTEELAILSERELKRVEDSPMFKFQKAVEDLKVSLVPLGEAFLKAVTPIVDFGAKLLEKFNNLDEGAKSFVVGITAVLGAIGPIAIMSFGLLANGVANIIKGFMFVKNVFSGAGNSSRELGSQLQYMTNEQLEAAAVAASLDQVHNRLIQTFSSEAGAINNLAAAYQKAIAAQSAFTVAGAARGPIKKFATGGFVSGSGSGDTVPAMLTPGEFVVKKQAAQSAMPLLEAINSGKIKGFSEGGQVGKGGSVVNLFAEYALRLQEQKENMSRQSGNTSFEEILAPLSMRVGEARGIVPSQSQVNKGSFDSIAQKYESVTKNFADKLNKDFDTTFSNIEDVNKRYSSAWTSAGKSVEDQVNAIRSESDRGVIRKTFGLDEDVYGTMPTMPRREGGTRLERARKAAYNLKDTGIRSYTSVLGGSRALFSRRTGASASEKQMGHVFGSKETELSKVVSDPRASNAAKKAGTLISSNINSKVVEGVVQSTRQASPSKEAHTAGKNIGEGTIRGIRSTTKRAQIAGQAFGLAATTSMTTVTPAMMQHLKSQAGRILKPYIDAQGNLIPIAKQKITILDKEAAAAKKAASAVAAHSTVLTGSTAAPGMSDVALGPEKPNRRQRLGSKIKSMTSGGMSARALGGAGMASSGVLMATSMVPGIVGEISQQLMMPAMLASMILPMTGALAPVILALAALAGGALLLKNAFDSAEKAARENALATGSGNDAIEKFANFAGKVSAGEIMDKRRSTALTQFGVQSGKESFGNLFLQSEDAKGLVDSLKALVASGASSQSMVSTTKNQLATSVAAGALTRDQAASIAGSVGEALGDRSFGIKVIGELNELIGIDGSNLLTDPITLRVKLIQETNSTLQNAADAKPIQNAQAQIGQGAGLGIAGGVAGGVGGSIAGAFAGAALTARGFATVGALAGPVGAAAGAIAGAAVGAVMLYEGMEKAGAAAGSMNAQGIMALQQNQQMLDSLDLEYEKRIAVAEAAGDLVTAQRLTNELEDGRTKILAESQKTIETLVSQYTAANFAGINPMGESLDKTIDSMYKDNPLLQQVATGARRSIEGSVGTGEQEYTLKLMLASGNIDPGTMSNLMAVFGNDQDAIEKLVSISLKLGSADAGRAFALADLFKDTDMKTKFIASVETKTPENATKLLDMFETVQQSGGILDMQLVLDAYMADPKSGDKLVANLEYFKKEQAKGPITTTIINTVFGAAAAAAVAADWTYFSGLDKEMQFTYMTLLQTTFETVEKNRGAYDTWVKTQSRGADTSVNAYASAMATKGTVRATEVRKMSEGGDDPGTGGGGGGPSASVLDSLLKKLKEIRNIQVKVTEGFAASANELAKWLGGASDIKVFTGIKQQMRALGAGEDLITLIAGMDPKEYEKQKNKLFEFDKNGNIVKLKDLAKATGKALKEIALGEFQNQQKQIVVDINNQQTAMTRLVAAGISVSDAYNMVEDAAFAAAVAAKDLSDEELLKIVKATKEAIKQMKLYKAAQTVKTSNEEFSTNSGLIAKLAASNFTDEQRRAILDDKNLQELYMKPELSEENIKEFRESLANAVKGVKVEFDTNNLTTEGLETNFANAMNKALERVNAQEVQINLKYDKEQAPFQKTIEDAQQKIADYQFELDDLDASLKPIEEAENKINEQYDARIKALDEVSSINDDISRQQKQQLSVAEAITSGDIGAAARAAQEARAANAADAVANQKKALETNRDLTLAGLVNAQGLTRTQVEEKIEDLKTKIFNIEEQTLEPAQRLVELSERRRDAALAEVEATKLRLQLLQNEADIAKTNQPEYVGAEATAGTIQDTLIEAYANGDAAKPGGTDNTPPPCKLPTKPVKAGYTYTKSADGCSWIETKNPTTTNNNNNAGGGKKVNPAYTKAITDQTNLKGQITKYDQQIAQIVSDISRVNAEVSRKTMTRAKADAMIAPMQAKISTLAESKRWTGQALQSIRVPAQYLAMGGMVKGYGSGGMVPKYFNAGGIAAAFANTFANNTDTIPAMLTPGEFVIKKSSVDEIGYKNLQRLNNGETLGSNSVYNYDVSINVRSEANVNDISRAVITEIKRVDSQRLKGNRL